MLEDLDQSLGEDLDIATFAGKRAITETERIRWVRNHLDVKVSAEDSPDAGAYSMLKWARGNRAEFFKAMSVKLLPKQSEIDRMSRAEMEDGELVDVLDKLIRYARRAKEQGRTMVMEPANPPRVIAGGGDSKPTQEFDDE